MVNKLPLSDRYNKGMEDVYQRFHSYDFDRDHKFQNGLTLLDGSSTLGDGAPRLEIKLLYYNRFIEPIDAAGYKQRSCYYPGEVDCDMENQKGRPSQSEPGISMNEGEETQAAVLSFQDVIRLVQAGETVPGQGAHLDITPSNQNPTPSKMERVAKPWETR